MLALLAALRCVDSSQEVIITIFEVYRQCSQATVFQLHTPARIRISSRQGWHAKCKMC